MKGLIGEERTMIRLSSPNRYLLLFLAFGFVIALIGLSLAAINSDTVTTNSTNGANSSTFFVLEDTQYKYILAINNSAVAAADNITAVNVTLPTGFLFLQTFNNNGTNDTYYVYTETGDTTVNDTAQFSNTTGVLKWNNTATALIRNSTRRFFLFNASASDPGTYNLSIQIFNNNATSNGTVGIGNSFKAITIVVNDTTSPDTVLFGGDTEANRANLSRNNIFIRVNFSDNGAFRSATINLFNSTANYTLVNQSVTTTNGSSYSVNFTSLADGVYYVNATMNDTFNNVNSTTSTYNITVDRTTPVVSHTCTPNPVDELSVITCTCSATDATSGVKSTSSTLHPSTSNTGTHTTNCVAEDYSGNSITNQFQYTVSGVGASSSSAGGGSGSGTTTWTTHNYANQELSDRGAVSKEMGANNRISVKVKGETHHVGVVSLSATSAEIEVSSTPQKVTMSAGETKKFDVTNDNIYDMKVTLVSIANNRVNLNVEYLQEAIPADAIAPPAATDGTVADTGTGDVQGESGSSTWIWVTVIAVILIVLIVWWTMKRKSH